MEEFDPFYEGSSEGAWSAVLRARAEAGRRGDALVGTGHLLVALTLGRGGLAQGRLRSWRVNADLARSALDRLAGGEGAVGPLPGQMFTGLAADAVDLAACIAFGLGDTTWDTAHLLIALAQDPGSDSCRMLELLELRPRRVRAETFRVLLRDGPFSESQVAYYGERILANSASAGLRDQVGRLVADRHGAFLTGDWERAAILSGLLLELWSDLDFLRPRRWRARARRRLRQLLPPIPAGIPDSWPPRGR